jgi:2-polyprenyl-3-methyl-5-hydroxy-6-metoxy-1,4-benzoquinol methylase
LDSNEVFMTGQINRDLHQQRVKAAECSAGISSNAIYAMVERVMQATNVEGRILDYGAGAGNLTRRLLALRRFDAVAAADIMAPPPDLAPSVE